MWGYNGQCRTTRPCSTTYRSACASPGRYDCYSGCPVINTCRRSCSAPPRRRQLCEIPRRCCCHRSLERPRRVEPMVVRATSRGSVKPQPIPGSKKQKSCPCGSLPPPCVCNASKHKPCLCPAPGTFKSCRCKELDNNKDTPSSDKPSADKVEPPDEDEPLPPENRDEPGSSPSNEENNPEPCPKNTSEESQECPPCPITDSKKNLTSSDIMGTYDDSGLDHEYVHFLLRITEDILRNDMYTNSGIDKVIECHFEANKNRLNEQKMREQIDRLKQELKYPLNNRSNLGKFILCGCESIKSVFSKNCNCCSEKTDECKCKNKVCPDYKPDNTNDVCEESQENVHKKPEDNLQPKEEDNIHSNEISSVERCTCPSETDSENGTKKLYCLEKDNKSGGCDCPKEAEPIVKEVDSDLKNEGSNCNCTDETKNNVFQCICIEHKNQDLEDSLKKTCDCNYIVINYESGPEKVSSALSPPPPVEENVEPSEIKSQISKQESVKKAKISIACVNPSSCDPDKLEYESKLLPPVSSKLNSAFKIVNPDQQMEKTLSHVAFYNPDPNACHCTASMKKTALKIEGDSMDEDQEYILVEGPVCIPMTMLKKKTTPVMIENYPSVYGNLDESSSNSKQNFLMCETHEDKLAPLESISGQVDFEYDMTPQRDSMKPGKDQPVEIKNEPEKVSVKSQPPLHPLSCRDRQKEFKEIPPSAPLSCDFREKYHFLLRDAATSISSFGDQISTGPVYSPRESQGSNKLSDHTSVSSFENRKSIVHVQSPVQSQESHIKEPTSPDKLSDHTSVSSFENQKSAVHVQSPVQSQESHIKEPSSPDRISDHSYSSISYAEMFEKKSSSGSMPIDKFKIRPSGEIRRQSSQDKSAPKIFKCAVRKNSEKEDQKLDETEEEESDDEGQRIPLDQYLIKSKGSETKVMMTDDDNYDHKDIIKKLDEIPVTDSLDRTNNNADAVADKMKDFRKLGDDSDQSKRFNHYMTNIDEFEIRRQSSQSDQKLENSIKADDSKSSKKDRRKFCC